MDDHLPTTDYVRVILLNVRVDVRVGLHPWEKHPEHPARLQISVELFARPPAVPASIGTIVDYDRVHKFIVSLAGRPHVELLETLIDDIVAVCFQDQKVLACRVKILKPDIFNEADAAGVEVYRTRAGWTG